EALLRLRQACCDPALLKLDDGLERSSAKLERLMDMVLELLSEGRKIIVFSQFTSMIDLIRLRFDAERIRYSVLTGRTVDRKGAMPDSLFDREGGPGSALTEEDVRALFDD